MKKILILICLISATPAYSKAPPHYDPNFNLAMESYAYLGHIGYICQKESYVWDIRATELLNLTNLKDEYIQRLFKLFLDTGMHSYDTYKTCDQEAWNAFKSYKKQRIEAENLLKKRYGIDIDIAS